MRFILVFAPILGVIGYLQFRGGFSTSLLLAVVALHGLVAGAAGAVSGKKTWARPVLMAGLAFILAWYAFALVSGLMGLAGGGFSDPAQRPGILAHFVLCFIGLAAASWLLLSIGLSRGLKKRNKNRVP